MSIKTLCLHSKNGAPSPHRRGGLIFHLEDHPNNVRRLMWESLEMEMETEQVFSVVPSACRLLFSESMGGEYYDVMVPCGRYTREGLWRAIEASIACAPTKNMYTVRYLEDAGRLCIASNHATDFTLHLCQDTVKVRVSPCSLQEYRVTPDISLGKGARATLCLSSTTYRVRVVSPSRIWCRDKIPGTDTEGTLVPDSRRDNLGPLLGFGTRDLSTEDVLQDIDVFPSPLQAGAIQISLPFPHGCEPGDEVTVGDVRGMVYRVASEHHVVVVPESPVVLPQTKSMSRPVLVGKESISILQPRQILYMRCWVGGKEAGGMVLVKPGCLEVFGRARRGRDECVVRGDWTFHPGLARVSTLEIVFVTDEGVVVHAHQMGPFSLLLTME